MKVVSVFGCGWLGFPLAKNLIKSGYEVKGSTTSAQKLSPLMANRIIPFKIRLDTTFEGENIKTFFECDYLIINFPPPRIENVESFHSDQIREIIKELRKSRCRKIIFISSTSVYGSKNQELNEESPAEPETNSGIALVNAEKILLSETDFRVTIIRLGGLIGEDRNPVYYFAGRKNIPGGNSFVNFIHQVDCIGIISKVIDLEIWGEIINGVCPVHPTKREFYTEVASKLELHPPEFDETIEPFKIVNSIKLKQLLKYSFIYPDPFSMIK